MSERLESGWGEPWPAPAKLNLLLRIVGRRSDGYHSLQTVFQFIDRADQISFHPRPDREVRLRNRLPGVAESEDLTVRAARLLQRCRADCPGVEIAVAKNLPMGGGLGGGSSDAATVLVMLNRLWALGLSTEELMALGLKLGADVPVFIFGHAAWAEGVGEVLEPVQPAESWYVVLVPDCQVSTAEVFRHPDLTRDSVPATIDSFNSGLISHDCAPVVSRIYPRVEAALEALSRFGEARLTGTGACVFLACADQDSARDIACELGAKYSVFVVKGCNRSPLYSKIASFFDEPE